MKKVIAILFLLVNLTESLNAQAYMKGLFVGSINGKKVNLQHEALVDEKTGSVTASFIDNNNNLPEATWWIISVTGACANKGVPNEGTKNLFLLSDGNFTRTLTAKFSTGHTATSVTKVTNIGNDNFSNNTEWNGTLPDAPKSLSINDIIYTMKQESKGKVSYNGRVTYLADGKLVWADVFVTIEYSGEKTLDTNQIFSNTNCSVKREGNKTTFNLFAKFTKH